VEIEHDNGSMGGASNEMQLKGVWWNWRYHFTAKVAVRLQRKD
jgi:hypothetical protein